ncbi:MAG TPA: flagellar basal-body MS-ring/collar protein FliF [Steroidobacteraceae bacterium]|nr:flagellar basal-body MS-ring/collar protein FliF [Steroidobacteraceae bacterium]
MAAEAGTVAAATGALPSGLKPLLLLVGLAAAVAAGLTVALWWRGPSYSLLYANLGSEDQAQIAQALDAAQIPYRLQPGSNAIEVSTDRLTDARLKLAGQGLPESGGGFAALDKDPGFGVSQFVENARYQHALETELARTIASLKPVEAARVHLAVPRQSAFVREHRGASASVFVQLKAGRRLAQEQVQAIINLVASSIPELEPSQVTVVDQQGRLLSTPDGHDEFSLREQQFDMAHRLEDDYRTRVESLLAPLVGAGRVRAQVVAQMDMSVTEEAREQYRPESQIVRSEQTSEQTTRDAGGSQGVPGALSNQPPPAGVASAPPPAAPPAAAAPASAAAGAKPAAAPNAAAAAPAAAGAVGALSLPASDSSSKETTRNYEIDRTLAYTRQPAGKLKRLTVAVLIDDAHTVDKDGKPRTVALTAEQLEHVTQLVKDAVGFDESRGDVVNVVNSSFTEEPAAPAGDLEKPPLWEKPLFFEGLKIVLGAIVLIVLVLTVLRPLMRSLMASLRTPRLAAQSAEAAALAGPAPMPAAVLAHEQQLAQARTLVSQDPKRVAQVVRDWVDQDA